MPSQRPIFATLALVYCLLMGIFALIQNPRSKLNRNFALYNFCNALYNIADWVIFIPNHNIGVWWIRITGIGACFMLPFLMLFVFELTGVSNQVRFRTFGQWAMRIGIFFAGLHLTPLILRDANYIYGQSTLSIEVPGKLYPLFGGTLFWGLTVILWSVLRIHREAHGIQRVKLTYVVVACGTGALALGIYFLSFSGNDFPMVYYTLQALVAFIFSYAIFKHELIPLQIAFRRTLLIIGIYILLGILIAPFFLFMRHSIIQTGSWSPLLFLTLVSGSLFSLGPVVYGQMVRRSALFQDTAASHITHEFRTPLHAIQSAKEILVGELAQARPDKTRVGDYMDMIERNTTRLEKFVSEILTTMKAEKGPDTLNKEHCDPADIARDAMSQFPKLHSRFRLDATEQLALNADKEALFQIFSNLLSNATKFAPEGHITIRIKPLSNGIEVSVQDEGQGIKSADLKKVFEPFSQSKGNALRTKGTGLGLAIAKRWVEAHGGKIWAESDGIGKGARFVVVLPL